MSAVAHLAEAQQALLDALWAAADLPGATRTFGPRGLEVHRAQARAHATQALMHAYPVVGALIGEDSHAALAQRLWRTHPPRRGDLAHWGRALPGCIEGLPGLARLPYLGDVARVEWALHEAAGAPDVAPALTSLTRLVEEDPAGLTLSLAPGTTLLTSPWPVVSIVRAHQDDVPSLATCGERLRAGVAETALVWRAAWRPSVRAVDAAEAAWLAVLLRGAAVSTAFDAALAQGDFDIGHWLARSAQDGLLIGVTDAAPPAAP